eukprot:gnl/TRDRNA2_/TRDRNA2_93579_c0_seq2.p2 gnl/TRDRNA2_/TRDRNA2_93579_c0~~gnl/TRDRNA2_/TRDRNA2_93579_c0_seq2.p2  ORF type:complete len:217 (-),score=32.22 gnl/TRDRNA2_/TRDRNA2_93579_c0_seq2:3-653(-)
MQLPAGTKAVKIAIGPNGSPLVDCSGDSSTFCIDLETRREAIEQMQSRSKYNNMHPNRMLLWLGISDFVGLAQFDAHTGFISCSESFSKLTPASDTQSGMGQDFEFVPAMTLADLLESISSEVTIDQLFANMQGHDFAAIRSAGGRIKRVKMISAEVWNGTAATYGGVRNSLQNDWLPYMAAVGFIQSGECEQGWVEKVGAAGADELDCTFVPAAM